MRKLYLQSFTSYKGDPLMGGRVYESHFLSWHYDDILEGLITG